jgi:hypothetical protein
MHHTHQSEKSVASARCINSQQRIAFGVRKTDTASRQLVAIHYNSKDRCIAFHYKEQRWDVFESLRLWDIPEAFRITLGRIEEAKPGTLVKAAALDDKNWQSSKRRTRRYISESPELLYINSPHLQAQSEEIAGYHVLTNIPWRDIPHILQLVCNAAAIEYGSPVNIPI